MFGAWPSIEYATTLICGNGVMKNFIKRIMGIDKLEQQISDQNQYLKTLQENTIEVDTIPEIATISAKEQATLNKEPYISVTETHVNKDNIRNGFFELDWNEYFVLQLRENGYIGDSEESIVDQWFQELCRNIGSESGVDMSRRGSGYVNLNKLDDDRTEIN